MAQYRDLVMAVLLLAFALLVYCVTYKEDPEEFFALEHGQEIKIGP